MPNLTKKELEEKKRKVKALKSKKEKAKLLKQAQTLVGEPEKETPPEKPAALDSLDEDPWTGLTERQVLIQRLKMRGMSQTNIGTVLGISQPMVNKELKKIREVHKSRGVNLDKDAVSGYFLSVYEEVENKAWEIFSTADDNKEKIQALTTIMSSKEKQMKLMTDLGLVEKAADKVNHTHELKSVPLLDNWDTDGKNKLSGTILESQLSQLEEPVPPQLEADIQDAEIIEDDNEEVIRRDNGDE